MPSPAYGSSNSPSSLSTGKSVPHYLHPDYLDPHSPSTDTKLSPLALLAETCNNIGKDFLSSKLDSTSTCDRKTSRSDKTPKVTAAVVPAVKKPPTDCGKQAPSLSAGSSPRSLCPDTSRQSPSSSSQASPNSTTLSRRERSRSPLPRKPSTTTRRSPSVAETAPPISIATTDSSNSLTSPASLLASSYLGYNPYSALAPWSAALMASHAHSAGAICQDPYCPHCHVTHRPCACLQCLQHKLLTEPYNYLAGLSLPTPPTTVSPPPPPTSTAKSSPGGMTAKYCIYCGKHCPSTEDLLSHMQLHVKNESLPVATQQSLPLYPSLDLAHKLAASSPLSTGRPFHPFRPPMPSRLAAHLAYPFGAGLV